MKSLEQAPSKSTLEIDADSSNPKIIVDAENKSTGSNTVLLSPGNIVISLSLITILLAVSHLMATYLENTLPEQSKLRRVMLQYFHFGLEANFPTYFSAVLLLLSSIISFCLYKLDLQGTNKKNARYWLSLSLIFLFLSADEAVQIHEQLMSVTHYLIPNLSSVLASAWVVPYALIGLLVVFYFLKFLFRLPGKTRNLVMLAGFIFVTGALGLEVAETYLHSEYGVNHILFTLNILIQELFEMAGIVLFIYALLNYSSSRYNGLQVKIK